VIAVLEWLWIGMLSSGVLLFILSLVLALRWRVFSLIDEVSGRKAKRQIAKLRAYNANGEMSSASTGELELLTAGGGSMVQETITIVDSGHGSLKSRIDDPYGSVGKNAVKTPVKSGERYAVDETVTGILSDIELETLQKKSVIILDEQSSL
jgi:hypothetical protein